jgi:hypothetical protein
METDTLLFSSRSIWTMIHGVVLGGGALMGLFAALFSLYAMRTADGSALGARDRTRSLAALTVFVAVMLWLTVLIGTYVVFPPYRAPAPEGLANLGRYPRSLLLSNPDTRWLHSFAMELKEHAPWIAAMLATPVAFVSVRYRARLLGDPTLRRMAAVLLGICFLLSSLAGLLGIFVNKVAPLE